MDEEYFDINAQRGESFVRDYYYRIFDSPQRMELARLYKPNSVILWNGNRLEGADNVRAFLKAIPASSHKVECIDVQPIPHAVANSIVIIASGEVNYGVEDNKRSFHQQWVLCPDTQKEGMWWIATDVFRLLQ